MISRNVISEWFGYFPEDPKRRKLTEYLGEGFLGMELGRILGRPTEMTRFVLVLCFASFYFPIQNGDLLSHLFFFFPQ